MTGSSRITTHTVLSSGLRDADIRPPDLLNEFRRLSVRDAAVLFPGDSLAPAPCPACGKDDPRPAFTREGFTYQSCGQCRSVYVSPRPTEAALRLYFAESEASRFRVAQLSEKTAAQRRRHQLRTNALWMGQVAEAQGLPPGPNYADFRTHAPALFDEVAALNHFGSLYAIEPLYALGHSCAVPVTLESVPPLDTASAFEKLEHQFSPLHFLESIGARMKPGGLLFLTTRTSSGFDLQLLGGRAPYIFVPEHLNLLSTQGIERLLQRSAFELVELSTPGQLDVELVLQACADDPSIVLPPFFSELLARRDRLAHGDFQAFLQKHRLSSHVRVAARKVVSNL